MLSVLLGDAKKDLSGAFVRTADSYFHGGVDIDCGHREHAEGCTHADHDGDCPEGHGHEEEGRGDPWRWINDHVRAPHVDRHLKTDKAKEILPWYWLAVRSNPHDVEVWANIWYVAAHQMKDAALALQIVEEATRENPESVEIACLEGRTFRMKDLRDDVRAEKAFTRARTIGRDLLTKGRLAEGARPAFLAALQFLSVYAERRGDRAALGALLEDARRTNPRHVVTQELEDRLRAGAGAAL